MEVRARREDLGRRLSPTAAVALALLPEHGFAGWEVRITPWRGTGVPQYVGRTFPSSRLFEFSAWLDDKPEWVRREIVLHEMAHAIVGHGAHDVGWKTVAKRLGCRIASRWYD